MKIFQLVKFYDSPLYYSLCGTRYCVVYSISVVLVVVWCWFGVWGGL